MTQILKSTVPINAHFENNILLYIKSLKVQKSCLPSPAPTYESQDVIFKITCEILTYMLGKADKV